MKNSCAKSCSSTNKERLILRREYDYYLKTWKYLAVFPDERANVGKVACLPFYFSHEEVIFESFCEASLEYYYKKTKCIKANLEEAIKCKIALEKYYNTEFRIAEKVV